MKIKIVLIVLFIFILIGGLIFYIFFNDNEAKNMQIGNNSSSQEIVNYILNISSYEATIEVNVQNSKNSNKYIIKQKYIAPNEAMQEVVEPSNIAGVKIIRKGNELTIENSNLDLVTVYNNYEYISENTLDLDCFLNNYKQNEKSQYIEENEQIVMKTSTGNMDKVLYINRNTAKPSKMVIKDNSKKNEIYILYNEVNINSLRY